MAKTSKTSTTSKKVAGKPKVSPAGGKSSSKSPSKPVTKSVTKSGGGGASKGSSSPKKPTPAAKAPPSKAPLPKTPPPKTPPPKTPPKKAEPAIPKPSAKTGPKAGAPSPKPAGPAAKGTAPAKVAPPPTPTPAPAKAAAQAQSPAAPAAAAPELDANGKKLPVKGITVVTPRPMRRPKVKKLEMPISEPLIKPGAKWKPLIPSGPKAPPTGLVGGRPEAHTVEISAKARLNKKELDKYREILLAKRRELAGDVSNMEDEALRQNSAGSLSNLPQHMAEQGSDTFEQSLSLDLAQVDRNLIREIDEALMRIEDGTYGVCLRTGERISADRLAELPWAKHSIEAQREMDRRSYTRAE